MAEDTGDKTEDATPQRREEARQKGNVAQSKDLTAAGLMLATAAVLLAFMVPVSLYLAKTMQQSIEGATVKLDGRSIAKIFNDLADGLAANVLPGLILLAIAAVIMSMSQVGLLLSPEALQPKFSRLNPLSGLKRILSISSFVKLIVSFGKLLVVVSVAWWAIALLLPQAVLLNEAEPAILFGTIHSWIVQIAFQLAFAMLILGMFDYAFQKWKFEQDLKMTKQEVRDEMKNMEGDPHIRQRRKETHRKLAEAKEMNAVKEADVIINNPTHISVALKYDPSVMDAPIVVAKGIDDVALRIRERANQYNIPMIERKPLARLLYKTVKVGHPIPVDLYEVFVEIMAYIYKITGRTPP